MILKKIALVVCAIGLSQAALAADIEAGKKASGICAACHGVAGISGADIWPNLAGQKQGYLVKQIKAFRDGTRNDPTMAPMAKALPEDQIENVAAYYASLK
jgi:cytochrome c553